MRVLWLVPGTKCTQNGGFSAPNIAFLEDNFQTIIKFSDRLKLGQFVPTSLPRHDATACEQKKFVHNAMSRTR